MEAKSLPPPLVKLGEQPAKFIKSKLVLLAYAIVGAWTGTNIVAAIYYLLFQTTQTMNDAWHRAVPNDNLRHSIRDVFEGVLGGLLAVYFVRNRYKKLGKPVRLNWLDRLEQRLGIPNAKDTKRASLKQLIATPFLAIAYGSIGFFAMLGIIWVVRNNGTIQGWLTGLFSWLDPLAQSHLSDGNLSLMEKLKSSLTNEWPNRLTGYATAFFFGRRPAKGVMDDLQLWLSEQRYLHNTHKAGKLPWYHRVLPPFVQRRISPMAPDSPSPWYYPPTWKATFNDIKLNGLAPEVVYHPRLTVALIPIINLVCTGLAVYGFYVLTFIATR